MQHKPNYHDDEIDLFELLQSIWQEKLLVLATFLVSIALAVAFALTTTPTYKVSATLKELDLRDIEVINSLDIIELNSSSALQRVAREFNSYPAKNAFYQENMELFNPQKSNDFRFDNFIANSLTIKQKTFSKEENSENSLELSLKYNKPIPGVELVNELTEFLINRAKNNLLRDLATIIDHRIEKNEAEIQYSLNAYDKQINARVAQLKEQDRIKELQLNDELKALISYLKQQRDNRIKTLDEALAIAKKLGIEKPTLIENPASNQGAASNITNSNQNQPLYFMGVNALKAEKENLLSRTSDDFTSSRVSKIKQELELLKNNRQVEALLSRENTRLFLADIAEKTYIISKLKDIDLTKINFELALIDQLAQEPSSPIKPQKSLIAAIGAVIGLMLGIFIALVVSTIKKRKLNK